MKKGFTLIELQMVIAVLAIILAFSIPQYRKSKLKKYEKISTRVVDKHYESKGTISISYIEYVLEVHTVYKNSTGKTYTSVDYIIVDVVDYDRYEVGSTFEGRRK